MIRPCDKCGGTGEVRWHVGHSADACLSGGDRSSYEHKIEPCDRCTDMPWLTLWRFPDRHAEAISKGDGPQRLKPDRSTVMRWCSKHNATAGDEGEIRCDSRYSSSALTGDCDIVWIERPTPLQVVVEDREVER